MEHPSEDISIFSSLFILLWSNVAFRAKATVLHSEEYLHLVLDGIQEIAWFYFRGKHVLKECSRHVDSYNMYIRNRTLLQHSWNSFIFIYGSFSISIGILKCSNFATFKHLLIFLGPMRLSVMDLCLKLGFSTCFYDQGHIFFLYKISQLANRSSIFTSVQLLPSLKLINVYSMFP